MISFVIPAYNATKTILRTIDSILAQKGTTMEFEIIVVDDGSTDNLRNTIKQYSSSELKNIKYYKKENGGVSSARNYGVKKASGEYIIFVDSDDIVSKNLLKDIGRFTKKGYDLIKWNHRIIEESSNEEIKDTVKKIEKEIKIKMEFEELSGEEGFNKLYGSDPLMDCLWNYAIKKEIMLEFPEGMYHEDFAVMPLIILRAQTMVITNQYEYYYIQTENSIMRGNDAKKQKKKLSDILKHYDKLIKEVNKLEVKKETKENMAIFATNSLLVIVPELNGKNKEYFEKELKKRKVSKNIRPRNIKQLIKRILLSMKY